MSIKTTHQQRLDYLVTLTYNLGKEMSDSKWRITVDFTATVILGGLAFYALSTGNAAVSGLFGTGITLVNTITGAELLRAIRETKAENREQLVEDE